MSGARMSESMGRHLLASSAENFSRKLAQVSLNAPYGKRLAVLIHKDRGFLSLLLHLRNRIDIISQGSLTVPSQRHSPFLIPFSHHANGPLAKVDLLVGETRGLRHANSRGIKKLHQRFRSFLPKRTG